MNRRQAARKTAGDDNGRKQGGFGVIQETECYTLEAFCERAGLSRAGVRIARRRGLRVRRAGRRSYIIGRDFFRFLEASGGDCEALAAPRLSA